MASYKDFKYSEPITEKIPGESPVYRYKPLVGKSLIDSVNPNFNSLQDCFLNAVKEGPDRPFLFSRNPANDNKYESISYSQTLDIAKKLASGLTTLGLIAEVKEWNDLALKLVSIYSKNRKEWLIADIASSWLYGITVVPLYDTLGPDTISYCLNHTGTSTVFCDSNSVSTLLKTQNIPTLKNIILFDPATESQIATAAERNIKLWKFQEVIDAGTQDLPFPKLEKKTIMTFSYTSGTTGVPKGVLLSHGNFMSTSPLFVDQNNLVLTKDDIHISYLPLPHVLDRLIVLTFATVGAQIYFYGGDVQKLAQDILEVRPTILISVPRLYNRFYDKIKASFAAKSEQEQALINAAIAEKLELLDSKGVVTHEKWDPLIFDKIKQGVFGGRVRYLMTGSAPISREVVRYLKVVSCTMLMEGYGMSESTGPCCFQNSGDPESGVVGGPTSLSDIKLVDIPEMNYLSTDVDANGVSMPRGEICIKGPGLFQGYYKDEAKTKEAIDENGWLHSGDVGMIYPNGSVKIIDRKKNIFKLSQAEYVAPDKIEGIYKTARGVQDVFVYGDSLQSHVIAIVVPDPDVIQVYAKELNLEGLTLEQLCQEKAMRQHFLKVISDHGKKAGLFGFENIKNLALEPEPFLLKNILTVTQKLQRHSAKLAFAKQIEDLYAEGVQI